MILRNSFYEKFDRANSLNAPVTRTKRFIQLDLSVYIIYPYSVELDCGLHWSTSQDT